MTSTTIMSLHFSSQHQKSVKKKQLPNRIRTHHLDASISFIRTSSIVKKNVNRIRFDFITAHDVCCAYMWPSDRRRWLASIRWKWCRINFNRNGHASIFAFYRKSSTKFRVYISARLHPTAMCHRKCHRWRHEPTNASFHSTGLIMPSSIKYELNGIGNIWCIHHLPPCIQANEMRWQKETEWLRANTHREHWATLEYRAAVELYLFSHFLRFAAMPWRQSLYYLIVFIQRAWTPRADSDETTVLANMNVNVSVCVCSCARCVGAFQAFRTSIPKPNPI